jgi:hypothetical protein
MPPMYADVVAPVALALAAVAVVAVAAPVTP